MTREEVIFAKLLTLNVSGNFGRNSDDILTAARIISADLESESVKQICNALDWWRKNRTSWPKVAELREVCDSTRTIDESQARLPVGLEKPATPGTGWLANKFLEEGRTLAEFQDAQIVLRETYERCRVEGDSWPNTETEFEEMLSFLFGDRERTQLVFGVPRT